MAEPKQAGGPNEAPLELNPEEIQKALEKVLGQKTDRGPDLKEILEKKKEAEERLKLLYEAAETLSKELGESEEQLDQKLANPNNFTKEEWEEIQKIREEK